MTDDRIAALRALSDEELTKRCAERVMGWVASETFGGYYVDKDGGVPGMSDSARLWHESEWNPLCDENHTALVREHLRRKWAADGSERCWSIDSGVGGGPWDVGIIQPCPYEGQETVVWVEDPSLARAVVLAALASVGEG